MKQLPKPTNPNFHTSAFYSRSDYIVQDPKFKKPLFLPEKFKKSLGNPKKPLIFMR